MSSLPQCLTATVDFSTRGLPLTFDPKKKKKSLPHTVFQEDSKFWVHMFIRISQVLQKRSHPLSHNSCHFPSPTLVSSSSKSVPRQHKRPVNLLASTWQLPHLCIIATTPRQFARLSSTTVATTSCSVCSPLLDNCYVGCSIRSFLYLTPCNNHIVFSLLAFAWQLSRWLPRQVFSLSKLSHVSTDHWLLSTSIIYVEIYLHIVPNSSFCCTTPWVWGVM